MRALNLPWLARRLLALVPTLWLATTLSFFALELVPGDPAGALLAPNAPPEKVDAERAALGLNDPVLVRYVRVLAGYARGDLGLSWVSRRPVAQLIAGVLPATLALALTAGAIALSGGIAFGGLAARLHGRLAGRAVLGAATLGLAVPVVASGVLALGLLGPRLGAPGRLWLPAAVLGLAAGGALARLVYGQLVEVYTSDYVRTARSKGLRPPAIFVVHALRNALIPVVTALGLQFGFLLGGAVLTELVFSRAGLGRLLLNAILDQDLPVVQGAVMTGALFYGLANVAADAAQAWLDPRLRESS
jgi:peptide/nickel transport system permease protein